MASGVIPFALTVVSQTLTVWEFNRQTDESSMCGRRTQLHICIAQLLGAEGTTRFALDCEKKPHTRANQVRFLEN
jgi:hypothetical protein